MSKKNKKDSIEYLIDYYKEMCYDPSMFFPATATIMGSSDERKILYIRGLDLAVNCLILDESYKKREVECTTSFSLKNKDQVKFNVYVTGSSDDYADKMTDLISANTKSSNPNVKLPTVHDADGFIQLIPKNFEATSRGSRWNVIGPQYQQEDTKLRNGVDWRWYSYSESVDSDFEETIITALHVSGKVEKTDHYDYPLDKVFRGTVDANMVDAIYGFRDYISELSGIDMSTTEIAVMLCTMNRIMDKEPRTYKRYGWDKNWVDSARRAKRDEYDYRHF